MKLKKEPVALYRENRGYNTKHESVQLEILVRLVFLI